MIESPPFPRRRFWASSPSFMGRGGRTISQTTRLQLSMYRKLCPSNVEALGSGERESGIRVNMSRSQSFGWRGGENVNAEKCRKVELTSASVKSVLWGGKPRAAVSETSSPLLGLVHVRDSPALLFDKAKVQIAKSLYLIINLTYVSADTD